MLIALHHSISPTKNIDPHNFACHHRKKAQFSVAFSAIYLRLEQRTDRFVRPSIRFSGARKKKQSLRSAVHCCELVTNQRG
jgi:hypothetical protein